MTLHATFLQFATFLCSGFHASLLFQSFQSDYERRRVHRGIQQPPCQLVFFFMNQSIDTSSGRLPELKASPPDDSAAALPDGALI